MKLFVLQVFDAQVVILEHKSIICAGYSAVMHIHCAAEEVTVKVRQHDDERVRYDDVVVENSSCANDCVVSVAGLNMSGRQEDGR